MNDLNDDLVVLAVHVVAKVVVEHNFHDVDSDDADAAEVAAAVAEEEEGEEGDIQNSA